MVLQKGSDEISAVKEQRASTRQICPWYFVYIEMRTTHSDAEMSQLSRVDNSWHATWGTPYNKGHWGKPLAKGAYGGDVKRSSGQMPAGLDPQEGG